MFIGKYNKSLIITYIGVAFALVGMYYAFQHDFRLSMICLVTAGVCDLFDGKVARMCKRTESEKLYGIEIDSLADMVGFVVFPVVVGYALGLTEWYNIIGYVLLVLAGITRLAFFNISVCNTNRDVPVKTYSGLPVTSTSVIFPFIWFLSEILKFSFTTVFQYIVYVVALLFVLNFKIPKLRGKGYIIVALIAAVGIALLFII